MFSIPHLIVIFVVALVVFGPEKLPELARNLGKVMAEFRRATGDLRSTFEGHLRDIEREAEARRIAAPATASSPPGTVQSSPPNASALALEGAPIVVETGTVGSTPPPDPRIDELYASNPKLAESNPDAFPSESHPASVSPEPSEHSQAGPLPN